MLDRYKDIVDGENINVDIVEKFLKDHSFNIPEDRLEVTDSVKSEVENILGKHNPLTKLLLTLFYFNFININDNGNSNFTREKELKIYNINREEILENIDNNLPVEKLYNVKITDIYYETSDLSLKKGEYNNGLKSSIRVRKKEIPGNGAIMHYCTIKKENPDNDSDILKDVYEFEFLLTNPIIFTDLIRLIGLYIYKAKIKNRDSFKIGTMTLDLDEYYISENNVNKIDTNKPDIEKIDVLEIETGKESHLIYLFKGLGIEDNKKYPKFDDGFGKMFQAHNYKIQKLIEDPEKK